MIEGYAGYTTLGGAVGAVVAQHILLVSPPIARNMLRAMFVLVVIVFSKQGIDGYLRR